MSVQTKQYWVNGPPPGIYEGLIDSGLISKSQINMVPQRSLSPNDTSQKHPQKPSQSGFSHTQTPKLNVSNPNISINRQRLNKTSKPINPIPFAQYRPKSATPGRLIHQIKHESFLGPAPKFEPLLESPDEINPSQLNSNDFNKPNNINDLINNINSNNKKYSVRSSFDGRNTNSSLMNDNNEENLEKSSATSCDSNTKKNIITRAFIDDYSNAQRTFAGRKEAKALLQDLDAMVAAYKEESITSGHSDPIEQFHTTSKLLSSYFLIWNKLIVQLRSHNEDHAVVCQRIKQYVQSVIQGLPQLNERYEKHMNGLKEQLEKQQVEINKNNHIKEEMTSQLNKLTSENEKISVQIQIAKSNEINTKEEHNNFLYQIETQRVQIDELSFKIGKLEESKTSLINDIKQRDSIIENCQKQIANNEETIKKFEEEGAGYRPLFTKAKEEVVQLKETIEKLKEDIQKLRSKDNLVNVATEPIL
ncbi:hypothetical protein TRFO_10356 [Tritrichomonas foetus]|uniref:Uncharacterized protein n=1 Tax=Tritrichomonas foetus TaxID=1144522 RepID=A0A1J4J951_9EUKA|nr:hypothetical protein TRFO_10356 [Tritrichomonas foetus]|eukprot:OHS95714.1 hypothetical protein TRFO_10356 [Tritrichomonas foetus]